MPLLPFSPAPLATPVSVANGGTGDTSLTAYAVLCGGTTSTNPIQSIAGVGTSGQVLTSNGASLLPTFQDAAGAVTSVSNSDSTLTISPTTGAVVASLNLSKANTWTVGQTFQTNSPSTPCVTVDWTDNGGTNLTALGMLKIRIPSSLSFVAGFTGIYEDLSTNVAWLGGTNRNVTGLFMKLPATTASDTAGVAAIAVDSNATLQRVVDLDVANLSNSIFMIRYGSSASLNGAVTAFNIDLSTNVTPGASGVYLLNATMPGTSRAGGTGESAIFIDNNALYMSTFEAQVSNKSGTIQTLYYQSAATLDNALTGFNLDLNNAVTPGANNINGIVLKIAATTRANNAAEGAFVINSDAITARVLDIDVGNTSSVINKIYWGSAATLVGEITTLYIDNSTNITLSSQKMTGIRIDNKANTERAISYGGTAVGEFYGSGSPESVVTASIGSLYRRTDGGSGTTLYVKESGTGNTGWTAAAFGVASVSNSDGSLTISPTTGAVVASLNVGNSNTWTAEQIFNRAIRFDYDSISGNTTLDATYCIVECNSSGGAFTVTLPTASGITGRMYVIKKTSSDANVITVDGNGTETIDGNLTVSIIAQWSTLIIFSNGTNWIKETSLV